MRLETSTAFGGGVVGTCSLKQVTQPRTPIFPREGSLPTGEDALREGEVRPYHPAPMARQQKKTKKFCIKIGYGNNNAYMANSVHKASQVLRYDTANEAVAAFETVIIPSAKAGEFDVSLKSTLDAHKERSEDRKAVTAANRRAFEEGIQNDETFAPKVAAE